MLDERSCGAVVFKRNGEVKYLLLQYESGYWDFVKGNREPNENEKDTVKRELKEETGIIEAKFIEGFREKIVYFYKRQSKTVHKEVIFFIVEAYTDKVSISFEHIGYEWLNYESAIERLTFKNSRNVLHNAHEFLKKQGIIKPSN
ncbi:MAG: NUDIX domain-containing protein [Candidatus Bathyarchaeia archaeon]